MGILTLVADLGGPCAQRSSFVRPFSCSMRHFGSLASESISPRPCLAASTSSAKVLWQILSNFAQKGRQQESRLSVAIARPGATVPMDAPRC